MEVVVTLESTILNYLDVSLKNPFQTVIPSGITAVLGPNGCGKSTLAKILTKGRNISLNKVRTKKEFNVKFIQFADIYSLSNSKVTYHQQRYESSMNDEVPTVREIFNNKLNNDFAKNLLNRLGLSDVENKKINFLSSGEIRKLMIWDALSDSLPNLLIIDNPFIGLDFTARDSLNEMLTNLKSEGLSIILLVCDASDLESYVDYIIPMKHLTIGPCIRIDGNIAPVEEMIEQLFDYEINKDEIPSSEKDAVNSLNSERVVVSFKNCNVAYEKKILLRDINWEINKGDRWILTGANGSGKSTLLSLIHADNPQAYSNDIFLFGRKRGTGETIWEVKKRIGYISSEMHLYFGGGNEKVVDIVARGLLDTVGSFIKLTEEQYDKANKWIKLLHLEDIAQRRFNTLSDGEQRLTLLARTFVKNPELIILDEPMHGLDSARKKAIRIIINDLVEKQNSTFIFVTHCPDEIPEGFDKMLSLS